MEPSGGGTGRAAQQPGRARWAGEQNGAGTPRSRAGSRPGTVPFWAEPEPDPAHRSAARSPENGARRDLRAVGRPREVPDFAAPDPAPPRRAQRERRYPQAPPSRIGTWVRGLTGSLAYGLVVLGLFLIGVQVWAGQVGWEGPGIGVISAHLIGGLLAAGVQAYADRNRDRNGGFAVLGVPIIVIGTLWFWWWM